MEDRLLPGVGVFGTGINTRILICVLRSAGFEIQAIWGRTEDEAQKVATMLGIPFSTNKIDDLLLNAHVDLVCINCPPFLHSQIAVKTLGIGKNVLCERPAGLGYDDTLRMLNAAKYYPSLMSLMTYHFRFLPTFEAMRRHIRDDYIGEILIVEVRIHCGFSLDSFYNWTNESRMGGGILNLYGHHIIDILHYISGQKAVKVHGFITTFKKQTNNITGFREITSDDFCNFQMKLDNGTCCTCVLNNNVPGKFTYDVLAIGTKACLLAKDGVLYGQHKASDGTIQQTILEQDGRDIPKGFEALMPSEVLKNAPIPLYQGMFKFVELLKQSFSRKTDPKHWDKEVLKSAATFEDALYVQTVLESIRRSSKTSDWEKVNA